MARKKARRKTRRSRRRSDAETVEQSIETLGSGRLRRGRVQIGDRTRWLTPTTRGFAVVRRRLSHIRAVQVTRRGRPVFTYDLDIRFRGRNGRLKVNTDIRRRGIPLPKSIKPIVRLINQRRRRETRLQATHRVVMAQIRGDIRGVIQRELGGYLDPRREALKIGKAEARRRLNRIKRTRDIRFRIAFFREI